ncbi:MAG: Crp/Fnr family transcriptional regulator [Thermoguttaceae bacterium]
MKPSPEVLKMSLGMPSLPDTTIKELIAISEIKTYESNNIIYRENEESTQLIVVLSGQVDIQYMMPNGKRETVDICGKGDMLVWSALVEPYKTNSSGICRAKAEILAIDGIKLRKLCEKETSFGFRLMSAIAGVIRRRLQAARKEIVDLR